MTSTRQAHYRNTNATDSMATLTIGSLRVTTRLSAKSQR
jgi:hypothetical protein